MIAHALVVAALCIAGPAFAQDGRVPSGTPVEDPPAGVNYSGGRSGPTMEELIRTLEEIGLAQSKSARGADAGGLGVSTLNLRTLGSGMDRTLPPARGCTLNEGGVVTTTTCTRPGRPTIVLYSPGQGHTITTIDGRRLPVEPAEAPAADGQEQRN